MVRFNENNEIIKDDEYKPIYNNDWRNSTINEFKDARWLNGMDMSINYNIGVPNKKVVVGHWHTSYGHVRKLKCKTNLTNYKDLEFSNEANFDIYEDDNGIMKRIKRK